LAAWHFAREVEALQALRGVSKIVAVTLMAELGDLTDSSGTVDGNLSA